MGKIEYIDYETLDEFYAIRQLVKLFGITKQELKEKCEQYGIFPRQNEIGYYGFVRYDVRKLHYRLYHESRGNKKDGCYKEDDPWA